MDIDKRVESLIAEFENKGNWEDRYKYIISIGKELAPMKEEWKLDNFKVKGCQSQVWLFPEIKDGIITFHADSDASITKGIVAVLLSIYSESTPEEILKTKPEFLETIGLRQHLSMSRANGLSSMVKQISMYAIAFQAQQNM
jgi:cysteine desulfuration protein SufE